MRPLLQPRFAGAHLLMVAAVVAAVLLGIWQLHVWQVGRESSARDLTEAKAKALESVMGADDSFPGRYLGQPVQFTGRWMGESTLFVADRELDGERGYWVVTPVLVGDSAMPVVRGWSARPEASTLTGRARVTGWLQASEGSSGASDTDPEDDVIPEMRVASITQRVDADLYSGFVVRRDAERDLEQVTPASIPEVSSTDHLQNLLYGFQWWIFGGLAIYIWWRWCRDQLEAAEEQAAEELEDAAG